jgi:hypothetical protein
MKNRERGRRKKIEEKTHSWAGFGPAHAFGPGLAHFKKKLKKKIFFSIYNFPVCIVLHCFV